MGPSRTAEPQQEDGGPAYRMADFYGAVITKDWVQSPCSHGYQVFVGRVSVLAAKAMCGFEVHNHESNWVARVEGPTQAYNFPGCQVRSVMAISPDVKHAFGPNTLVVP